MGSDFIIKLEGEGGNTEKVTFHQRLEGDEGVKYEEIWRKSFQGRGDGQFEGHKAGPCLMYLSNSMVASVAVRGEEQEIGSDRARSGRVSKPLKHFHFYSEWARETLKDLYMHREDTGE